MAGRDAEPPVQEVSPKSHPPGRLRVISYRVRLDVPVSLVWFVSGLLAARRREIGTRKNTRSLGCYRQALFGLAWFRDRVSVPRLGAGFGLSQATAYRYLDEVTEVLAARAPDLREALERALADGTPYVILDGTLISGDRCREKTIGSRHKQEVDAWYSGKKKCFGGNIQGVFYPDGRPMWVSDVLPGRDGDLAAAKELVFGVLRPFTGRMPCLADGGYEPAGHGICTPAKRPRGGPDLGISAQARNMLLRSLRCLGERGFALLKQRWHALQHVTASPGKIGDIARAALVLTLFEHKMLT
jgi:DDE superfamily endonuclease